MVRHKANKRQDNSGTRQRKAQSKAWPAKAQGKSIPSTRLGPTQGKAQMNERPTARHDRQGSMQSKAGQGKKRPEEKQGRMQGMLKARPM